MKTIAATFAVLVAVSGALLAQQTQTAPQSIPKQIPDYTLGPLDEFQVTVTSGGVLQADYLNQRYTVSATGEVVLPSLRSPVKVGGLTVEQAKAEIKSLLEKGGFYVDPQVTITMTAYKASQITVQGAVRNAGKIGLSADLLSLPDAINAAGGLTPFAGARIMIAAGPTRPKPGPDVLVEDGQEIYRVADLQAGQLSEVRLYTEDTVIVEIAPRFYVNGFVRAPGDFAWAPGMILRKAIVLAGGVTPEGAENRIKVERKQKNGSYKQIKLAKDKMSTAIEPEDVVTVPKRRM